MSSPAIIVLGFPYHYYRECEVDDDEKCCDDRCHGHECCDVIAKRKGYIDGHSTEKYEGRYGRGTIKSFGAGYENHEFGRPSGVLGHQIASTWNDAISLDAQQVRIRNAKRYIEKKLGQYGEPSIWFIGQQT